MEPATMAIMIASMLSFGAVGTPVAYDYAYGQETTPDSSMWGLERAGETIQGAFMNQEQIMVFSLERAQERLQETWMIMNQTQSAKRIQECLKTYEEHMNHTWKLAYNHNYSHMYQYINESISQHQHMIQNMIQYSPVNATQAMNRALEIATYYKQQCENHYHGNGNGYTAKH